MRGGLAIPVALGISLGILLIAIFFLSPRLYEPDDNTFVEIALANATLGEIFQGKEQIVTSKYEGIMSIPDYECHVGRCILLVFSPAGDPEKQTAIVYVNKDIMKVADIRASEDYLIAKASESAEGQLFLSKYPNAEVYASLDFQIVVMWTVAAMLPFSVECRLCWLGDLLRQMVFQSVKGLDMRI